MTQSPLLSASSPLFFSFASSSSFFPNPPTIDSYAAVSLYVHF